MIRVAGTDPGTSSLDVILLEDGIVTDQCRFTPQQIHNNPNLPIHWLASRGPFDCVAGPSGYGIPLKSARDITPANIAQMVLTRPDMDASGQGVLGFRALLRAFCEADLPVVFLPAVIHLPTVPIHRKHNRIDLGTADKLCVAALALAQVSQQATNGRLDEINFCLIELGSYFTACIVLFRGQVVDGMGGTSGPIGWRACGAWDGETAYLLSPIAKQDLFSGGACAAAEPDRMLIESIIKAVAALQSMTPFGDIVLSGKLLEDQPESTTMLSNALTRFGRVQTLPSLPGAWVKHAAQGAAIIADGLSGGTYANLVGHLKIQQATGTCLDWVVHPRMQDVRTMLGF